MGAALVFPLCFAQAIAQAEWEWAPVVEVLRGHLDGVSPGHLNQSWVLLDGICPTALSLPTHGWGIFVVGQTPGQTPIQMPIHNPIQM